jgi:hypothetical protein
MASVAVANAATAEILSSRFIFSPFENVDHQV